MAKAPAGKKSEEKKKKSKTPKISVKGESANELMNQIEEAISHRQILDLLGRFSEAADAFEPDLMNGLYWADAEVKTGIFSGAASDFVDFLAKEIADGIEVSQHLLGVPKIEISGDQATAEYPSSVFFRIKAGSGAFEKLTGQTPAQGADAHEVMVGAAYSDVLERRKGEWRIREHRSMKGWMRILQ